MPVSQISHLDDKVENWEARGSCFLCGGFGDPVVLFEDGYFGRACPCGVVYIDPYPAHDSVSILQDHHLDTYYSLPATVRLDFVARHRRSGRLLEVGCGSGELLALARKRGYEIAAVEPNPEAAGTAEQSLGIEVERALIEESRLPSSSFDVVFHVDLLSHFPDPIRALRKMADLLRPGGVVCFELGISGGLPPAWYRWVGRIGYPQHLWLYSEAAMRTTLARAGLGIESIQRFGLFPATLLSSIGNRFLRQRISRPASVGGRPARATGFYRAYSWLQYVLRYKVGRFVPPVGPHAILVAARRLPLQAGSRD